MTTNDQRRRALLTATAADVGRTLFALRCDQLSGEGRRLEGGWPGTLQEARALTLGVLASIFAQRRLSSPTTGEVDWVMVAAYDEARRAWRASSPEKRARR